MQLIKKDKLTETALRPGTVVWRTGGIMGATKRFNFHDVWFEPSNQGTFVVRVLTNSSDFLYEPIVYNPPMDDRRPHEKFKGIIAFIQDVPPPNWTAMIVTGRSKAGTSLFLKTVNFINETDYKAFREAQYHNFVSSMNSPHADQLAAARKSVVTLPPGNERVYVAKDWQTDDYWVEHFQ